MQPIERVPEGERMRVLVGCERSGRVRDAFLARGHDAVSCDIEPTDVPGPHIQGDVLEVLDDGWDLMIAFPECTYLSIAGNAWWNHPGREEQRIAAARFFMALYNAPIPRVCIENPVGWMNTAFRPPDQTIHPFFFGHPERKRTCLWLRGLPLLNPTELVWREAPSFFDKTTGKARYFVDSQPPSSERKKNRSRTFEGIARAMADQWGERMMAVHHG